jgi:hypothetical protein
MIMNLDQQRKMLIQTLNHRWRDPSLSDSDRQKSLTNLLKVVNGLPGKELKPEDFKD